MNQTNNENDHSQTLARRDELLRVQVQIKDQDLAEPGFSISAFIIYDQFTAALKACTVLRRATVRAKVGARWEFKPWRTDVLKLPMESERALLEATNADVVVFVGPHAYSLPVWLKSWLERWAERRVTKEVALVVVQDRESSEYFMAGIRGLYRFAVNHGLDLITGSEIALETCTEAFVQARSEYALPSLAVAAVPVRTAYQAWGINE